MFKRSNLPVEELHVAARYRSFLYREIDAAEYMLRDAECTLFGITRDEQFTPNIDAKLANGLALKREQAERRLRRARARLADAQRSLQQIQELSE